MHFNFDPMNIDLSRPGEAFLKCIGFVSIGNLFEISANEMHLPPIILEIAQLLAYMGASVAFFKFIINLFNKKKTRKNNLESNP